jgi:hypothetical protein
VRSGLQAPGPQVVPAATGTHAEPSARQAPVVQAPAGQAEAQQRPAFPEVATQKPLSQSAPPLPVLQVCPWPFGFAHCAARQR